MFTGFSSLQYHQVNRHIHHLQSILQPASQLLLDDIITQQAAAVLVDQPVASIGLQQR